MTHSMKSLFLGVFVSLLCGCASNGMAWMDYFKVKEEPAVVEQETFEETEEMQNVGLTYRAERRDKEKLSEAQEGNRVWRTPQNLYHPSYTHKSLAEYAEQLTMELIHNSRGLQGNSTVGVASFVDFDSGLNRTSPLGNQLAEYFISEIQQFGVAAVDFKMGDGIRVHQTGDYVFSRNAWDLADELAIDYILAGTLISNEKGVKVNARVVSQRDKRVVSSGSVFIPHFVVGELSPKYSLIQ